MPKFHLFTLVVKMLISSFSGLSLTLPLAFFPCYLHKEIALLLLDYDLQLYILGQLPEQNVLHLQFFYFFYVYLVVDFIVQILLCEYFTV